MWLRKEMEELVVEEEMEEVVVEEVMEVEEVEELMVGLDTALEGKEPGCVSGCRDRPGTEGTTEG